MTEQPLLPAELLWSEGGHASDVVLTALADGEHAIVPDAVRLHVDGCAACTRHLGHAALLSLRADQDLGLRAVPARTPIPLRAVLLGLAVALLGVVPGLGDGMSVSPSATVSALARTLAPLARRIGEPGSVTGLLVTYATAFVLVVSSWLVVRRLPRKEVSS